VIGEFASESSQGESVEQLYEYAYNNGYVVSEKRRHAMVSILPFVSGN